jgi:hypothetical protein
MALRGRHERVVMRVASRRSEDIAALRESLEKSGIIYTEENGQVCFSVLPVQRTEDFDRAKKIFSNALLSHS